MEWEKWVGMKSVFIKLTDGQIFTNCEILAFEEPFMSVTDLFGYPAVINANHILKIKQEGKDGTRLDYRG